MRYSVFLLFVLYSMNGFSQKKMFYAGTTLGINYTDFSKSYIDYENGGYFDFSYRRVYGGPYKKVTIQSLPGIRGGGYLEYAPIPKLSLRTELALEFKTFNYQIEVNSLLVKSTNKFLYVDIPLLVNYNFTDRIGVSIGYQYAYSFNKFRRIYVSDNAMISYWGSYPERLKKAVYSSVFGINYRINKKLKGNLRYNYYTSYINGFNNSAIQLNLSYELFNNFPKVFEASALPN